MFDLSAVLDRSVRNISVLCNGTISISPTDTSLGVLQGEIASQLTQITLVRFAPVPTWQLKRFCLDMAVIL